MTDELTILLAELRADHRNMRLLMDLVEQESQRLYEGGQPDYDLLCDVMHYITVYPDSVHHPKEDRVYAELKAARQDLTHGFERIRTDHRDLAELAIKLRNDIELVVSGTPLRRNVIVADALRYAKKLRDHMHWEERDLFIRVEEMIRDGHALLVGPAVAHRPDPLFGPEVEKNFKRLLERVQEALDTQRI